jgi:hypothetical protein
MIIQNFNKNYNYKILVKIKIFIFFIFINTLNIYSKQNYEIGQERLFNDLEISSFFNNNNLSEANTSSKSDSQNINEEANKIYELAKFVKEENRFIDKLDESVKVEYPIGLVGKGSDFNYAIILNGDIITPHGTYINAYMSFEIPENGKKLAFKAERIPLSAKGGLQGEIKLELITNASIKFGKALTLRLSEEGTYVTFDCNGFKNMTINALIELSNDIFLPEDPNTGNIKQGSINFAINTTITSWNDLLIGISLQPFQVKNLKGFGFEVKKAVFDFSDFQNPSDIKFPSQYNSPFLDIDINLWRGIYIQEATVRLPKELNNGKRIEIGIKDFILDELGITGIFSVTNLIPIEKGSISGWAYSIDEINIGFVLNNITEGGMNGKITLPLMHEKDTIGYKALIDASGNFSFAINGIKNLNIPLWKANITLDPTSTIEINYINNELIPKAILNGSITIDAPIGEENSNDAQTQNKGFSIGDIKFQEMTIMGKAPYLSLGVWSLSQIGISSDKLNGFSLELKNIETISGLSEAGIKFTAMVSFAKEKYAAGATISILGTMTNENTENNNSRQRWNYKTTEVQDIYMKIEDEAISIEGHFNIFKNDYTYGKGFYGEVSAGLPKIDVSITAIAQFGEINEFKYWYVDAFVYLGKRPIPLASSGLGIYGLGGGAYCHMSQSALENSPLPSENSSSQSDSPSKSNSGLEYIPNKNVSFGFKASVALGLMSDKKTFNAVVTFEVVFNNNGGINSLSLYGKGYFMCDMQLNRSRTDSPPLYADARIDFDFANSSLHGNFKVFISAPNDLIVGVNADKLAGEVVMHWDKSNWYIHVGRPSQPLGVNVDVGLAKVSATCYFMMGTQIENMPLPPSSITQYLSYTPNRNLDELFKGKGFAFGAAFNFNTGNINMQIFYASFDATLGFDFMFGNFGDAYCTETNMPLGINGWYAQGQAYCGFNGKVGIRVTVFKKEINTEILTINTAAIVEAKFPNPFWMKGKVSGYYSILNGAVKGNCNFQFEVGQQCTIVRRDKPSSAVQSLAVISKINPSNGETNVDVFCRPQVVFNYSMGKDFNLIENNINKSYKIVLDNFSLTTNDDKPIIGNISWNNTNDVIAFTSNDILPGKTKLKLSVKIHFEEKQNNNWVPIKENGTIIYEEENYSFTTGVAPEYIPENNIAYSYPLPDMLNFYKNEYPYGYIQLIQGQEYLFNPPPNFRQIGRFIPVAGGDIIEFNFTYNASQKKIEYTMPTNLSNETIYRLEIINVPKEIITSIDKNVSTKTETIQIEENSNVDLTGKEAKGSLIVYSEKAIYNCYFRTSKFNTFSEKIKAIPTIEGSTGTILPGVQKLNGRFNINEFFDYYEFDKNNPNSLINFEASESAPWIKDKLNPIIYNDYPIGNIGLIKWRDISESGLKPYKNIYFNKYEKSISLLLTENEKSSGIMLQRNSATVTLYNIAYYSYYDFNDIQNAIANSNIRTERTNLILTSLFPSVLWPSQYPIKCSYTLPGIKTTTSTETINLNINL